MTSELELILCGATKTKMYETQSTRNGDRCEQSIFLVLRKGAKVERQVNSVVVMILISLSANNGGTFRGHHYTQLRCNLD